jgi:hypothetical protein
VVAEETFGGVENTTGSIQTLPRVQSRATTFGSRGEGTSVDTKGEGGAGAECRVAASAALRQSGGGEVRR